MEIPKPLPGEKITISNMEADGFPNYTAIAVSREGQTWLGTVNNDVARSQDYGAMVERLRKGSK